MNHSLLISSLLATLALVACDKPTVVNVPATPSTPVAVPVPVPVPGPAGPQGEAGRPGQPGQSGDTTVIVVPPAASAPSK